MSFICSSVAWKIESHMHTMHNWQEMFCYNIYNIVQISIECFHSRGQHLCKFVGTKESVCIRKEFNSHRIGLGHQHGRRFIVLGHQYDRREVMWKHSIRPSSVSKASTKEQITSKDHRWHINSHNYRGKFPEGIMAMNDTGHGKMKETLKVYRNSGTDQVSARKLM